MTPSEGSLTCVLRRYIVSLFQKCGTQNRVRYVDINKLRHGLGDAMVSAIPLLGCTHTPDVTP